MPGMQCVPTSSAWGGRTPHRALGGTGCGFPCNPIAASHALAQTRECAPARVAGGMCIGGAHDTQVSQHHLPTPNTQPCGGAPKTATTRPSRHHHKARLQFFWIFLCRFACARGFAQAAPCVRFETASCVMQVCAFQRCSRQVRIAASSTGTLMAGNAGAARRASPGTV